MQENEKGFSLFELLVTISIISIISLISINGFKYLVEKNKQKLFEQEATLIYSSFVETINKYKKMVVIKEGTSFTIYYYPFRALTPSASGEYVDDFDYEEFNNVFINDVFKELDDFKDGTLNYNIVNYTIKQRKVETSLEYVVDTKGKIVIDVIMNDANYTSYDTLTIVKITYYDLYGNSKSYSL